HGGLTGTHLLVGLLRRAERERVVDDRTERQRRDRQRDHRDDQHRAPPGPASLPPGHPQRRAPPAHRAPPGLLSSSSAWSRGPEVSTMTPSRRNPPRSAQAACRASWVTSTPAAPPSTLDRSSRSTASPVCESSAPVGSSASTSCRSPTSARAIATRCSWP